MTYAELKEQMVKDGFSESFTGWWVENQMYYFKEKSEKKKVCGTVLSNYYALKKYHKELYQ